MGSYSQKENLSNAIYKKGKRSDNKQPAVPHVLLELYHVKKAKDIREQMFLKAGTL